MARWSVMGLAAIALGCGADPCDGSDCDDGFVTGGSAIDSSVRNSAEDDDGDGASNAEEAAAGTDPENAYSRPYTGGYNVGGCDTDPVPTGPTGTTTYNQAGATYEWASMAVGDIPENFSLMDQHGEMVDLYSFCGKNIMLLISAGWCGPCRSFAEQMQDIQDEYRSDNLQLIEIITADNARNHPDRAFLENWANQYDFRDIPVLQINPLDADGDGYTDTLDHLYFWFEGDGYIPSVYHIGRDMKVLSADGGVHDPGSFL